MADWERNLEGIRVQVVSRIFEGIVSSGQLGDLGKRVIPIAELRSVARTNTLGSRIYINYEGLVETFFAETKGNGFGSAEVDEINQAVGISANNHRIARLVPPAEYPALVRKYMLTTGVARVVEQDFTSAAKEEKLRKV